MDLDFASAGVFPLDEVEAVLVDSEGTAVAFVGAVGGDMVSSGSSVVLGDVGGLDLSLS